MSFYESIAPWYNFIFPLSPSKVKFVLNLTNKEAPKITETGCATGEFALALANEGASVFGFDLDKEMINQAEALKLENKATDFNTINFKTLNMMNIDSEPLAENSDIVCCFGNTLVHLSSLNQIRQYFNAVYNTLTPQGVFTGQIVNYDRIIKDKAKGLTTIENNEISFSRTYSCVNNTDYDNSVDCNDDILKINFTTKLTVKDTGKVIENNIHLMALEKSILEKALKDSGFQVEFFGNYKKDCWTTNSGPTIFLAKKV